jgi:hypothetical protein
LINTCFMAQHQPAHQQGCSSHEVLTKFTPCGNCTCTAPPNVAVAAAHLAALQLHTRCIQIGLTANFVPADIFASNIGSLTAWSHLPSAAWLEAPVASDSLEQSSLTPENRC